MTEQADQAELLLDELEDLRQLLDKPFTHNIPMLKGKLDMEAEIPTLDDRVQPLSSKEEPVVQFSEADLDAPLSNDQISSIVDELVAEHLPIIEKKLRESLLEALSFKL
ncbi:hypothetical protein [Parendozoicomonas sp. Alg238-R29]|uniref:hypothetical protein n=1 Tax=Parendozoicomonas sp. Alg238-R29 TaxID=2993446 RepID=UPI00248E4937|nr:hypothetical protein [Parendozoicomonas sp. Alg238-R29]